MEEASIQFHLGSPLRGWLRRQGGMMRGWQRKYFVLKDNCLHCFSRADDTQVSNTYLLDEFQLKDVPSNPDDPDKFAFELVKEKNNGDSITLCAASDSEKKEWLKALRYHIYAGRGGAIFGLPLEEAMKYEHRQGRSVPYIVVACIKHLETFALETEGIFRLAGRAGLLRELRGQFEVGQYPVLDDVDVHTVGSLLKAYLRDLPESLVPPDSYQRVMNCAMRHAEATTDDGRRVEVECLCKLLEELPDINYTTLAYICRFLHRLAANADKTKMTAHNLALVFGPNLIRHLDNSPELLMLTADLTQHLAFMVITHCPDVLPPRPHREAVPDGPMLREKHPWVSRVATGDLLRMSEPLDTNDKSLLPPRPSALRDLMDLQFFPQNTDTSDKTQSPVTPPSPFVFVNDYFASTDKSTSEKREEARSGEAARGTSEGVTRPVAPKRKARSMRVRRSGGTPSSPKSPDSPRPLDSPRHLDSQDILAALASMNQTQAGEETGSKEEVSSTFPPSDRNFSIAGDGGGDQQCQKPTGHGQKPDDQQASSGYAHSSPSNVCNGKSNTREARRVPEADSAHGIDAGRVRPSTAVLEAQVAALKLELANVKVQSERMVAALKNQLTDIRSKYEARISSLETQQHRAIIDLTAKLDTERNARANAVEKTVELQAQLHKYKLQYGKLAGSHST
ncbi:uncharacterized protein LOC143292489 [Babylonia areolata]|uniref:uncharacterized protein LOC143292489 n=1 Tax=Babylonia areolata TaxID=304850 RepID=UPI003FD472D9